MKLKMKKYELTNGKGIIEPEPLKDKLVYVGNLCKDKNNYNLRVVPEGDIKLAVEWWKKYRDIPEKLMEKYPNCKNEICEVFKCIKSDSLTDFIRKKDEIGFDSGYWLDYDLWLINKAFEDVDDVEKN